MTWSYCVFSLVSKTQWSCNWKNIIWPTDPWQGTVRTGGGNLNLRSRPEAGAYVVARIPDGATVTVYGEYSGWYVVRYGNQTGYAASQFIT